MAQASRTQSSSHIYFFFYKYIHTSTVQQEFTYFHNITTKPVVQLNFCNVISCKFYIRPHLFEIDSNQSTQPFINKSPIEYPYIST